MEVVEVNAGYRCSIAVPNSVFCGGNLRHSTAGQGRLVVLLDGDSLCSCAYRLQHPCGLTFAAIPGQHPLAFQLLALKRDVQVALPVISFNHLERPDVPDHDRAAAVLPLRNNAFEFEIVERMILCRACKPAYARFCWNAFGHGP